MFAIITDKESARCPQRNNPSSYPVSVANPRVDIV